MNENQNQPVDQSNDLAEKQQTDQMAESAGLPQDTVSTGSSFFIAVDGDSIGARVGQAVLQDNVDEIKEISHSINAGQNALIDFVESHGGDVISAGGDEMVAGFPKELGDEELEQMRQQYASLVGATLTIGVGALPSEAGKALIFGKLNGKDQICRFSPEVEAHLYQVHNDPHGEEEMKQDEHYLGALKDGSDDEMNAGAPEDIDQAQSAQPPVDQAPPDEEQHMVDDQDMEQIADDQDYFDEDYGQNDMDPNAAPGEGEEASIAGAPSDEEMPEDPQQDEWQDPEQDPDLSHDNAAAVVDQAAMQENAGEEYMADDQGQGDELNAMKDELHGDSGGQASLKDNLASILESYIQEKEQLEQLAQTDPELYQDVLVLLQQMIVVAKKMQPADAQQNAPVDQPPVDAGGAAPPQQDNPHIEENQPMGKPQP